MHDSESTQASESFSVRFPTTSWSLITTAASDSSGSKEALGTLCVAYWQPVYIFIRRKGYSKEESEDLSQAFFTRLLEHRTVQRARRERGRFRSFLLASVTNFLANEWDRSNTWKRGGSYTIIPFDFSLGEESYRREPYHELTPELLFARQWALALLQRVIGRQGDEYGRRGQTALFELLKPFLTGDQDRGGYSAAADKLNLSEAATRTAVHRMRRRYAELLHEEIAATLADPAEADDEIRFLLGALGET